MNEKLEGKIIVGGAQDLPAGVKSLMGQVDIAEYEIIIKGNKSVGKIQELADKVVADLDMLDPVYEMGIVKGSGNPEDILLKLYGFTRTTKDRNEKVFKLRDFLQGLKSSLISRNMDIKSVLKKELYILKDGKKLTPFEVLRFYV
jgi:hypothetical protein